MVGLIGFCVTCKRQRGPQMEQKMVGLLPDRAKLHPPPLTPFTNVGFDVFGPWVLETRRTRGRAVFNKRWGLVFTCLASRAIHIEILESMVAVSFLCALRQFFSTRGPVSPLRSNRGTNFVGAKIELDHQAIEKYLSDQGCN